jgi:hypothetical protein
MGLSEILAAAALAGVLFFPIFLAKYPKMLIILTLYRGMAKSCHAGLFFRHLPRRLPVFGQ